MWNGEGGKFLKTELALEDTIPVIYADAKLPCTLLFSVYGMSKRNTQQQLLHRTKMFGKPLTFTDWADECFNTVSLVLFVTACNLVAGKLVSVFLREVSCFFSLPKEY